MWAHQTRGHFPHETESPWPCHFKPSHWCGKGEPVQVCCFTLRWRDQWSMWMQDGCKSLHKILHGVEWIMFHGHLEYFQKPPMGDHGTPHVHNRQFIIFYHVWGPPWVKVHWYSIWLRVLSYHFTRHLRIRDHTTWFWRYVGTAFGHFLLGSHNLRVMALGSCVKWPSLM
jgi:hypothetical protein